MKLLKTLGLPESDDPDYRIDGSVAHAGASACLESGQDAWELVGTPVYQGREFTAPMADGVQVYLDNCRSLVKPNSEQFIEYSIKLPHVHPKYFGTLDFGVIEHTGGFAANDIGRIRDYKNGAGVVVEVENNPQFMYYAYGLMFEPCARNVVNIELGVVQPNAYHPDGPVRTWWTTGSALHSWVRGTLVPAMERTEGDDTPLVAGEHCRFCPSKLICPLMTGLFRTASEADVTSTRTLEDAVLGQEYRLGGAVRLYLKALEEETLRRSLLGKEIPGTKLVHRKTDRIYKDGAEARLVAQFGDDAMTAPALKSPAQMEKVPGAGELVMEWAYSPEAGLTIALAEDKRQAVKAQPASAIFAAALDKIAG